MAQDDPLQTDKESFLKELNAAPLTVVFNTAQHFENQGESGTAALVYIIFVSRCADELDDMSLEPRIAQALEKIALYSVRNGNSRLAIRAYDQLLDTFKANEKGPIVDSQIAGALFNRGVLKRDLGESASAIESFDQVVRQFKNSTDASIRRWLALALHNKGALLSRLAVDSNNQAQFDSALAAFIELYEEFENDDDLVIQARVASAIHSLAEAMQGNGLHDRARTLFSEVIHRYGPVHDDALRLKVTSAARHILSHLPEANEVSLLEMQLGASDTEYNQVFLQILQPMINLRAARHSAAQSVVKAYVEHGSPFALFLRNFNLEALELVTKTRTGDLCPIVAWRGDTSLEKQLAAVSAKSIRMIGVANSADLKPRSDGNVLPMLCLSQEDWVLFVSALINVAAFIVLDIDRLNPGVVAELELIIQQNRETDTLVVLPSRTAIDDSLPSFVPVAISAFDQSPISDPMGPQPSLKKGKAQLATFPHVLYEDEVRLDDIEALFNWR